MKVLIACEESQAVTIELRKRGHEAYSCDIRECSGGFPEWHIRGDVLPLLNRGWDMIIAFPPCTYLTRAGAANIPHDPGRIDRGFKAAEFFKTILSADCPRIAVENPPPMKRFGLPGYTQIIHPYYFGDSVSKATCLWLKGLPRLMPTQIVDRGDSFCVTRANGKKVYLGTWFYNSGKLSKSIRSIVRSKTFPGVAAAMAEQWTYDGEARVMPDIKGQFEFVFR